MNTLQTVVDTAKVAKASKAKVTNTTPAYNIDGYFKSRFDVWAAEWGTRPTAIMLKVAMGLNNSDRPKANGCESFFIALQLRPQGCDANSFKIIGACGTANNHRNAVSDHTYKSGVRGCGYFTLTGNHLRVTDKGRKRLLELGFKAGDIDPLCRETKPAKGPSKPKGKAKAVKATVVAPAETPTSDQPSPAEGQSGEAQA